MAAKKRPSAGKRDLSAAVAQVHQKRKPAKAAPAGDPNAIADWLLLAAGDDPKRKSFFDHDDGHRPRERQGKKVHLILGPKVALPDYRTRDGQRHQRSMITIPPKLRESIQECFGAEGQGDFPLTTAIIALADYAAFMLKRDKKLLWVDAPEDAHAPERKAARKVIRQAQRTNK